MCLFTPCICHHVYVQEQVAKHQQHSISFALHMFQINCEHMVQLIHIGNVPVIVQFQYFIIVWLFDRKWTNWPSYIATSKHIQLINEYFQKVKSVCICFFLNCIYFYILLRTLSINCARSWRFNLLEFVFFCHRANKCNYKKNEK